MKIDKSISITLIIVLGIIILVSIFVMNSSTSSNTINVNGQSSIEVAPDLVKVYLTIQTNAETSQEAKDENAEKTDDVISALLAKGFEREDIQTTYFNIYPEYDYSYGKNTIKGYIASHNLVVEFSAEETDKIGQVIDAGIDGGANLGSISFELSQEKQNTYKAEAIKLAAEDAKIKAEALAEGLGQKVGKLVSVSNDDWGYSPWRVYEGGDMAVSMVDAKEEVAQLDIQPSERTISANVQATFKIY